jgi:hypothetical protein
MCSCPRPAPAPFPLMTTLQQRTGAGSAHSPLFAFRASASSFFSGSFPSAYFLNHHAKPALTSS